MHTRREQDARRSIASDTGRVTVPALSLVALIGHPQVTEAFAARHFAAHDLLEGGDVQHLSEGDVLPESLEPFEQVERRIEERLEQGRFTVVDAGQLRADERRELAGLARTWHMVPCAIVVGQMMPTERDLRSLGFRRVAHVSDPAASLQVVHTRMRNDGRHLRGPFDIIGDVHGCIDELAELLARMGWEVCEAGSASAPDPAAGALARLVPDGDRGRVPHELPEQDGLVAFHPDGRIAVFLGDLVDRGPGSPEVLKLVMNMVAARTALCMPGNHDAKFVRWLAGRRVQLSHGLAATAEQMQRHPRRFHAAVRRFLESLPDHRVLADGELVVAHAGLAEHLHGRASGEVRSSAMYGKTTGEVDEFGYDVRHDWAGEYGGAPLVVYGHTPVELPRWCNNTVNIDTGCVFGGCLTALRYPELDTVSVPARATYYERRGFRHPNGTLTPQPGLPPAP